MATGYISHYNRDGNYGYIDSPELQLDHIYFHKINLEKTYRHIYKGDKVSFDILETEGQKVAQNIRFIQNASLEGLRKDFQKQIKLNGFLKKVGEHYYVKDSETYIYIRLFISENEINIKENYDDKLNQLIDYKILFMSDKNKIRAQIYNRTPSTECYSILEKTPIEGYVIDQVKGGIKIQVFDKIFGFIPGSLALKRTPPLKKGDIVSVICINTSESWDNFIFDLTENILFSP